MRYADRLIHPVRTMARRPERAALLALGGVALACGCAGQPSRRAAEPRAVVGQPTITVSAEEAARYRDPVAAGQLRERAFDLLKQSAREGTPLEKANAMEAMTLAPGRLAEFAGPALVDPNPGVRSAAAMAIGRAKLPGMEDKLRPLLNDPEPRVRASVVAALKAVGAAVDPTPLADMVLTHASPQARAQAAFALGEIGDASALGLLRDAARRPMPRATSSEQRLVQLQIAEAMVKLGDDRQLEVLRAALYPARPEDLEAAALAVQILGQLRDRGSVDNLIYLTTSRDEQGRPMPAEIRLGAAAALARAGLPQGTFLADEFAGHASPVLRAQAAHVYGEIGRRENLAKLAVMTRDAESIVRIAAASAVVKVTSDQNANAGR